MLFRSFLIITAFALAGCQIPSANEPPNKFENWLKTSKNQSDVTELQNFLKRNKVDMVFPIEQLLRSDVRWEKCQSEAFSIPPKDQWANMLPTLQFVRDEIVPLIGPVEAQSVYRHPKINKCVGGATRSYHMRFYAIDMKPMSKISRDALIGKLCQLHAEKGRAKKMGLGIYKATRFHIDTAAYRTWGHDKQAASSPCLTI